VIKNAHSGRMPSIRILPIGAINSIYTYMYCTVRMTVQQAAGIQNLFVG
jgi:hypothetical protein